MATPLNEVIQSKIISHAHYLAQYENHQVLLMREILQKSHDSLIEKMSGLEESSYMSKWYGETLKQVDSLYAESGAAMKGVLFKNLQEFGAYEGGWIQKTLNSTMPKAMGLSFAGASPSQIWAAVTTSPADKEHLLEDMMKTQTSFTQNHIANAIRQGIIEGETMKQVEQRLQGTCIQKPFYRDPQTGARITGYTKAELKKMAKAGKVVKVPGVYSGGAMMSANHNAETVTRTAVMHVSNTAHVKVYQENAELLKGMEWLATLDTRTCPVCGSYDGKVFPLDSKIVAPVHHRCRCTLAPIVKSFAELGYEDEPSDEIKALDGKIPGYQTYAEWIAKQSPADQIEALGKARYEMMQRGVPITRFVNRGKVLTLEQIAKAEAKVIEEKIAGTISNEAKEAKELAEKQAKEAKELAEKIEKEIAEKLAKELAEKQAKELAEKVAKEKIARELAEKLAKEKAEKVAKELAKELAEKIAKELAEKQAKALAEKLAKEYAEKLAKEKIARELAEKAAKELAEKLAKELAEKVAKEAAEKALADKIAKELAEKLAKEAEEAAAKKLSIGIKKYSPVKTSQEAETFAVKEGLAHSASFKGLNIEGANAINASVYDNIQRVPALKGKMEYLGSAQEQNRRAKKLRMDEYLQTKNGQGYKKRLEDERDRYIGIWRAQGLAEDIIQARLKDYSLDDATIERWLGKIAYRGITPLPETNLARSTDYTHRQYKGVHGISVNEKFWGKQWSDLDRTLEMNVAVKYHPVGCDTAKSIIDHEVGHQVDDLYKLDKNSDILKWWDEMNAGKYGATVTDALSIYAKDKGLTEAIAEAWAEGLNNPNPRPAAKRFMEITTGVIGGKI